MPIAFSGTAHNEAYDLVEDFLTVLEVRFEKQEAKPSFLVPFSDSPTLEIHVLALGSEDEVGVLSRAWLVRSPPLTPQLLQYLLGENINRALGYFGVDKDGDVALTSFLRAEDLDLGQFRYSVLPLADSAARAAQYLLNTYGGSKFGSWTR